MFRIDLHTHSYASPDGGLRSQDYAQMLHAHGLHAIAVTDHDRIDAALKIQDQLGEAIIVGEEIRAKEGEIVGLYLHERIKPGMSLQQTVAAIKEQGGLVYLPHPFETVRHGIDEAALATISDDVDIIETQNGRAVFQDKSALARQYRVQYGWAGAASSDAHSRHGWGRTYTTVAEMPSRETLVRLLEAAQVTRRHPGVRGLIAPKLNRLRQKVRRG